MTRQELLAMTDPVVLMNIEQLITDRENAHRAPAYASLHELRRLTRLPTDYLLGQLRLITRTAQQYGGGYRGSLTINKEVIMLRNERQDTRTITKDRH